MCRYRRLTVNLRYAYEKKYQITFIRVAAYCIRMSIVYLLWWRNIGKEVPFTSGDVNPNFNVVNIIIEEYNGKGCFTARTYVQAGREMQVVQFPSQVTNAMQIS